MNVDHLFHLDVQIIGITILDPNSKNLTESLENRLIHQLYDCNYVFCIRFL